LPHGEIVLVDTQTGKEIAALPITKGLDDLKYDAGGKRIYAEGDGTRMSTSGQTWITTNSLEVPTGPVGPGAGSETVFRGSVAARNHERRGSGF